jgi:hypothetical protein
LIVSPRGGGTIFDLARIIVPTTESLLRDARVIPAERSEDKVKLMFSAADPANLRALPADCVPEF